MKKNLIPLLSLVPILLSGCNLSFLKTVENDDIVNYGEIHDSLIEDHDFNNALYLFPSNDYISEHLDYVKDFHYRNDEGIFGDSNFFYVKLTYGNENEFLEEYNRLLDVKVTFSNGAVKNAFHDDINHQVISVCVPDSSNYEYVIYDSLTYTFAYVANYYFDWKDLKLPSEYRLKSGNTPEEDKTWGFNIYYYYMEDVGYYFTEKIPEWR